MVAHVCDSQHLCWLTMYRIYSVFRPLNIIKPSIQHKCWLSQTCATTVVSHSHHHIPSITFPILVGYLRRDTLLLLPPPLPYPFYSLGQNFGILDIVTFPFLLTTNDRHRIHEVDHPEKGVGDGVAHDGKDFI